MTSVTAKDDDLVNVHPAVPVKKLTEDPPVFEKFPYGFERLCHMYSLGIPTRFEELQTRNPPEFLDETRERFKLFPDPVTRPAEPEDSALFDYRIWLEPILRKGQIYWDYCRDKWTEKESQLGSTLAPVSCVYSLWTIADACDQHGPIAFMIAYFLLTITFVIPLVYTELVLGQFHRTSVFKAVKQTCPLFQGLGYLVLFGSMFDYALSVIRVTWLCYILFSIFSIIAFQSTLPWSECSNPNWNTQSCKFITHHDETNYTYNSNDRTPAVEWYRNHIARPWKHWTIACGNSCTVAEILPGLLPNIPILMCFLLVLCTYFLLMRLWCKSLGTLMLTVFYIGFALCGFTLVAFHQDFPHHQYDDLKKYLLRTPKGSHGKDLWSFDTWRRAFRQAIIGSGVGSGIYVTFGSHFTFPHDNIKVASILSGLASYMVHLLVAGSLLICHVALRTTVSLGDKPDKNMYGHDSIFEMGLQVVAHHHYQGLGYIITILFGGGILLISSVRLLSYLHLFAQHFVDANKAYYEPYRWDYHYWQHNKIGRQDRYFDYTLTQSRRKKLALKIIGFIGLAQIIFLFPGGSLLLFLLEHFWYDNVPVGIVSIEIFVFLFVAGSRLFNEYVRRMTTWQITIFTRFLMRNILVLCPLVSPVLPRILMLRLFLVPMNLVEVSIPEYDIPEDFKYISILFLIFPYVFISICVVYNWVHSNATSVFRKILLEVSPQHDHRGIIGGYKPQVRHHWIHYLIVPGGCSRGRCLPSYESPPRAQNPNRWRLWNSACSFFWYGLGLCWLNHTWGCCSVAKARGTLFYLFPWSHIHTKPRIDRSNLVEYIPNQAIRRAHKLKTLSREEFGEREEWVTTTRNAFEGWKEPLDEKDIEMGLDQQVTTSQMRDEEGHKFFDVFDLSSDEEFPLDSSISSVESWDPCVGKRKKMQASSSEVTPDSFDSESSVFDFSQEEEDASVRTAEIKGDQLEIVDFQDEKELEIPMHDFKEEDLLPYDDESDSWDLEDLETLENAQQRIKIPELGADTTEEETDTDEIENSGEGENGEEESDDSDNEAGAYVEQSEEELDGEMESESDDEDEDSWSDTSCDSSCSSTSDFRAPGKTNMIKNLVKSNLIFGIKGVGQKTQMGSSSKWKQKFGGIASKKRQKRAGSSSRSNQNEVGSPSNKQNQNNGGSQNKNIWNRKITK